MMKKRFLGGLGVLSAVVSMTLLPALASAQEYQAVTNAAERPPATTFIAGAYGFIWVALLVYVVFLARGLGRVKSDLAALGQKVDRAAARPPSGPGSAKIG